MKKDIYILMADDDLDDQHIMLDAFKATNEKPAVVMVNDGDKLLSYLFSQETESLPRLIILDLNMPRMDGNEALIAIKADIKLRDIPVIIFSSSLNPVERAKAEKTGAKEFIIKPNTFEQCVETARKFSMYCAA